ncbi:Fyv7/TAP26 [Arabidopsis thaliana x Arabidopsis arenosa]|uniref:Fyv7/TAP26 n=1 Tax=Arabidopsis thaliana x Arabidopsis arenosa TaxID=1240361 RepID=A0A8T1Z402_9BRAS|nr:Fyv7/TAP26 [Arabidopsis thaliana x Arabidopsis arenosa]
MKKFYQKNEHETDRSKSTETKKRKNMKRLGGGGLSLQTFANMKSENNRYNPSLIKKQKEFYKNAKYVSKFRKSVKQQDIDDKNETGESSKVDDDDDDKQKSRSNKRIGVEDLYKQTREEMEKVRKEREATFQAKKEAKEGAESRRKVAKGKMMRKTRHGQPVMKYRIEHLLESIKKSAGIDESS